MSLIGLALEVDRILVRKTVTLLIPCIVMWFANTKLGDHVDILGRSSLNDLILRVAGGRGADIEESVHSNILEYAEKVKVYEE